MFKPVTECAKRRWYKHLFQFVLAALRERRCTTRDILDLGRPVSGLTSAYQNQPLNEIAVCQTCILFGPLRSLCSALCENAFYILRCLYLKTLLLNRYTGLHG